MKKIPMRSCIVTKEKLEKRDLIRVVLNKEKDIFVDVTGKANGRGAYLKKDEDVIEKAKKNKILDNALNVQVPEKIYEELKELCKK